ncbi:MAG: calcium-binding protein [Boseongicola sp.]|nr:MAG: calcium-binding protein [Boseongicola sp.]
MDHTTARIVIAAVIIGAGFGVANAKERGFDHEPVSFETLDVDGSGEIDMADLDALKAQRFAEIDTDSDGQVSEAEFLAHAEAKGNERATKMFSRLDADDDGFLSRDVLENRGRGGFGERMISRADTDDSGGINAEEFEVMQERMAEHRGKKGKRKGSRTE